MKWSVEAKSTASGHVQATGGIDLHAGPADQEGVISPDALLASAWAACFTSSLRHVLEVAGLDPEKFAPTSHVTITRFEESPTAGDYLEGTVTADFAHREELENPAELVAQAHAFCPFSKALTGGLHRLAAQLA